ncbi:MAG: OB-fold nucleic acid binding domain-containing protein [Nanobdellota archaeon]
MTDTSALLKKKILDSNKLTADELDAKLQEKLSSLGGLISEEGALHIIANELDIKTEKPAVSELKVKDILAGMRNVTTLAKVQKKYDIHTFGADKEGKVGNLFMADDTGRIKLTFWNDYVTNYFEKINEGDILEVKEAYTKENNGYVELHLGSNSKCTINPEGKTVEVKEFTQRSSLETKKIKDITEQDQLVAITATIVQAYTPRFFKSCPECGKRLQQEDDEFTCPQHGKQEKPAYNYVMNLFLDDGTDNMRATLWKEQIQELLSMPEDQIISLQDDTDRLEEIKTDLLGTIIHGKGKIKKNNIYNNLEIVIFELNTDPDPTASASATEEKSSSTDTTTNDPKTEPSSSTDTVKEESVSSKDDDLPSIDDIEQGL